jgi:predicted enzyme related to lactoylglutathione lyase
MFKNAKAFSSFSVKDITKAKKFYGQTLGLKISDEMGGLHLHLAGGNKIFVYGKPNHVPATFTVLNFLVNNVEKAVDGLSKKGVKFEIYNQGQLKTNKKGITTDSRGPKIAWFKDPAGNFLSVIEGK